MQIITMIAIVQWIQITFFTNAVYQINNNQLKVDQNYFQEFEAAGKSILEFQQFQAFMIFMIFWKILIFFLLPKTTYTFIEMLSMATTYIIFFMTLLFLVKII